MVSRGPDLALAVHVHGSGDKGRPFHGVRRRVDLKSLRRWIDIDQSSRAFFFGGRDVEPDVAVRIPHRSMSVCGQPMQAIHAEEFGLARFRINASETRIWVW